MQFSVFSGTLIKIEVPLSQNIPKSKLNLINETQCIVTELLQKIKRVFYNFYGLQTGLFYPPPFSMKKNLKNECSWQKYRTSFSNCYDNSHHNAGQSILHTDILTKARQIIRLFRYTGLRQPTHLKNARFLVGFQTQISHIAPKIPQLNAITL